MRDTVPALERTLQARIRPPVVATQSSYASVSRALQEESLSATEQAELLAAPLLILVLLLVFRSVVAAAIPLVFGALTVLAGRGVLALLGSAMTIDALALVVCTMMGLALGVDYSLLIVSRFREELAAGREPWAAAAATRASAGRTTLFAGVILIVAVRRLRLPAAGVAAAVAGDGGGRRHGRSASSSRPSRCRRCWRCSGSGSTPAGSAGAAPAGRVRPSPAPPPRRFATPPSRPAWWRCR